MKFNKHLEVRPKRLKSITVLNAENEPNEQLFDVQEFLRSPFLREFHQHLEDPLTVFRTYSPRMNYQEAAWLLSFDPVFAGKIRQFSQYKEHALNEFLGSGRMADTRHYEKLAFLLQLFPECRALPQVAESLTEENFTWLIQVIRNSDFSAISETALVLWPERAGEIAQATFPDGLNSKADVTDWFDWMTDEAAMSWAALCALLLPEHKKEMMKIIMPHVRIFTHELRSALGLADAQKTDSTLTGIKMTMARNLAILAAEKAYINSEGYLQLEFQPRAAFETNPLPTRPEV